MGRARRPRSGYSTPCLRSSRAGSPCSASTWRQAMAVRRVLGYVPRSCPSRLRSTGQRCGVVRAAVRRAPARAPGPRGRGTRARGTDQSTDRLAATFPVAWCAGWNWRRPWSIARPCSFSTADGRLDPIAAGLGLDAATTMPERSGMTGCSPRTTWRRRHAVRPSGVMHRGRLRAVGSPLELKVQLGPDASLEDVFRHHTGEQLYDGTGRRPARCA